MVREVGPLRRPDVVVLQGPLDRSAGERVVDHRRVVVVVMADRPHDRVLVSQPGEPRQVFADLSPGTLVAIGRKAPRISAGASGLRSHMSRCGGPPSR